MSTLISNIRGTTLRGCVNCTPSDSRSSFSPLLWNPRKSLFTKCTIHCTQIFGIIHCKQCWLWCRWLSWPGLFCLADKHVVSLPHTEKPHCGARKGKLESFKVPVKEIGYVNVAKSRGRGKETTTRDLRAIFLSACVRSCICHLGVDFSFTFHQHLGLWERVVWV